jgi:Ser/Thr protein kinase RdoA (MazF antagonist)
VGCIASRFIDGTELRKGDERHERLAFENLARIHRIDPAEVVNLELPGVSIDANGEPLSLEELRAVEDTYCTDVEEARELLHGKLRRLRDADVRRVACWRDEAEARMQEFGLSRVILHGDYNSSNLLFGSEPQPYTIDLDSVRAGPFRIELGTALLRTLYGSNSRKLSGFSAERLFDDSRLRAAEEAYFSVASDSSRKFWDEHREAVLLSTLLWTIWRFATRVHMAHRYSFAKRMVYRGHAFKRWKQVLNHLDRGH